VRQSFDSTGISLKMASFRHLFQPWPATGLALFLRGPWLPAVNPELASFRHFPLPPQSDPARQPLPARAHRARTPLVVRQSLDSIGINSKMASFRHFLAAPAPCMR
jgi:hypothetical protein